MSEPALHRAPVVIVGGGFGGLYTALALSSISNHPRILLIEPKERFIFLPLLYELLSGELKTWEVAPRYTKLLAGKEIALLQDTVTNIDTVSKTITTVSGLCQEFGQLVIATGTHLKTFNIPGVRKYAMTFHSLNDVERLQNLLKLIRKRQDLDQKLIIVGGGPTGVELACKLADLIEGMATIELIDQSDQLLASAHAFNRKQANSALFKRKISLRLQTKVLEVQSNCIRILGPDFLEQTISVTGVIWSAGIAPSLPVISPPPVVNKTGRLVCKRTLQLDQTQDTFVIGDIASIYEPNGIHIPSTAQVAFQQAELLSANIIRQRNGAFLESFDWRDLGEIISLGIGNASLASLGLTLAGPSAFQIRRLVYLSRLPGLSHQLRVATNWLFVDSD